MAERGKQKNWLPLESNPELMNKYVWRLGVSKKHQFHEIYGVDEGLLMMVPQPVHAVLMLFPISESSEKHKAEEQAKIEKDGQIVSDKVYHMKQVIGNACGTIGLCHAVLNNTDKLEITPDSFFAKFHEETKGLDVMGRAKALEANDSIEESHAEVAAEASSEVAHAVNSNLHFNAFACVDGCLYELDGRKASAINHGPSSPETLLQDAAKVAASFMARDPDEIRFNLVALGNASE